ncbi:YopX family protein [Enterococcus faecalis]
MIPKFRARDERGNWHVGLLTFMFGQYAIVNETDENTVYLIDKETIGQSTGFKDDNGVEIFEGDIGQYRDGEYSYLGIVKRDCYQFFIDGTEPDDSYDFIDVSNTFDGTSSLEVIGNIHENPELLEKASEDDSKIF